LQEILTLQGLFRFSVWSAMAALEPSFFFHTGEFQGSIPCAPTIGRTFQSHANKAKLIRSKIEQYAKHPAAQARNVKALTGVGRCALDRRKRAGISLTSAEMDQLLAAKRRSHSTENGPA
jgi:hypothetical protein